MKKKEKIKPKRIRTPIDVSSQSFEMYVKYGVARRTEGYTKKQLQLKRLIYLCGGVKKLMDATGLSRSAITRWLEREFIPVQYYELISELTGGKISRVGVAAVVLG